MLAPRGLLREDSVFVDFAQVAVNPSATMFV